MCGFFFIYFPPFRKNVLLCPHRGRFSNTFLWSEIWWIFWAQQKKYLVTAKKCTSPFRCSLASAFGSNHPAWITSIPDRWRAIILRIFPYEVLIVFVFYFDCLKHSNFYPNVLLCIILTKTGMIEHLWKSV